MYVVTRRRAVKIDSGFQEHDDQIGVRLRSDRWCEIEIVLFVFGWSDFPSSHTEEEDNLARMDGLAAGRFEMEDGEPDATNVTGG